MWFNKINQDIIVLFLLGQFFWLFILSIALLKTLKHYFHLIGKNKKQNLKDILEDILEKIKQQEKETGIINNRCDKIEKQSLKHLQKIGFLRFNPFSDTGGDQSFVLSFLDGEETGIVLSSLHSRGTTRLYAKSVKKGKTVGLTLSKEEKEAIKKVKRRKS